MSDDVKKAVESKNFTIGMNSVMRKLRMGKLKKVLVSKNCSDDFKENLGKYAKISNVNVIKLRMSNEQLGTACRKPFSVSIIGY